ncbi:MAG: hypothetical protein MUC54_02935, partial [Chloroflexi bacterium]|nr:hypothetical protein [Chloroflexota bacterium]
GAPQSSVRPLATGLATIGLAGLLLTSVPGLARFGSTTVLTNVGGATAPAEQSTLDRVGVEAAPGATEGPRAGTYGASSGAPVPSNAPAVPGAENPAVPGAENPAAQPSPAGAVAGAGDEGPATDDAAAGDPGRNAGETPLPDQPQPVPLVVVASIALLASGLALFAARWAVRRPRA